MTPERKAYAQKRIARLDAKREALLAQIKQLNQPPVDLATRGKLDALIKQRRSCWTSRQRWVKELHQAGLTP